MNAQEIIDASNSEDKLGLFYPEIAKHKQAEFNLERIAKVKKPLFA